MSTSASDDSQWPGVNEWRDRVSKSPRVRRILLIAGGAAIGVIVLLWLVGGLLYPKVTSVVDVTTRPSLLVNRTAVLQLRNTSNRAISGVVVEVQNSTKGQSGTLNVGAIQAGEAKELGILQAGWMLEANEVFTVKADGYRSATFHTHANDQGQVSLNP